MEELVADVDRNLHQTWDNILDTGLLLEEAQALERRINRRLRLELVLLIASMALLLANVLVLLAIARYV